MELDQKTLKQLLSYEPTTGLFYWRGPRQGVQRGAQAGYANNGYVSITINGKSYLAHRLAWLYVYGAWPVNELDHEDGRRDNNRISNLFDKTHAENLQGFHKPRSNNKSGYRGVTWNKRAKAWVGQYMRNGESIFCGVHTLPEQAYQAIQDSKAGKAVQGRCDPRAGKGFKAAVETHKMLLHLSNL